MFTRDMINGMDKAQVKAAKGLGSLLSDDDKAMLNDRLAVLTAPPKPTPFPRQAELTDAYTQWKSWGETIKTLHTEARAGNHTYIRADGETVKPSKARKAPVATSGKRESVTVDGVVYKSFTAVAEANPDIRPDLSRSISRNWQEHVLAHRTGTIQISGISAEEYAKYFPIPEGRNWTYEVVATE